MTTRQNTQRAKTCNFRLGYIYNTKSVQPDGNKGVDFTQFAYDMIYKDKEWYVPTNCSLAFAKGDDTYDALCFINNAEEGPAMLMEIPWASNETFFYNLFDYCKQLDCIDIREIKEPAPLQYGDLRISVENSKNSCHGLIFESKNSAHEGFRAVVGLKDICNFMQIIRSIIGLPTVSQYLNTVSFILHTKDE